MRKEVEEAVDAIRSYSVARRQEAVARARESLADADRRADRLQVQIDDRWSRMNSTARAHTQTAMAELRQRRNDAAEWTGALRHGSDVAWDDVKAGFVKSYHDLADALRRARAQLEPEPEPTTESTIGDQTSAEKQQEHEH